MCPGPFCLALALPCLSALLPALPFPGWSPKLRILLQVLLVACSHLSPNPLGGCDPGRLPQAPPLSPSRASEPSLTSVPLVLVQPWVPAALGKAPGDSLRRLGSSCPSCTAPMHSAGGASWAQACRLSRRPCSFQSEAAEGQAQCRSSPGGASARWARAQTAPQHPSANGGQRQLLPALSTRRSPPQNLAPEKIFHVVVAPCYDKKLEALREGFSAAHGARGADCVLTSGERRQGCAWTLAGPLTGQC